MSAALRKTIADLRRRKLQSAVIFLVVTLSVFAGTLALSLLVEANGPFDRAFQQANGAHLTVTFDSRQVSAAQLRSTANLPPVTSASGPYRSLGVPVSVGPGEQVLQIQGRERPDTTVDRLALEEGRWAQKTGEVVISTHIAGHGLGLGDLFISDSTTGMPSLRVVGIATAVADPVDAWVLPAQLPVSLPAPIAGKPAGYATYSMYYRLTRASTDADINTATNAIAAAVPNGAIVSSQNYLEVKRQAGITEAVMIPFLLALSGFALVAAALIVANVVTGAVIAGARDLGIMKAVGFTPAQLAGVLLAEVLAPAVLGCVVGMPLGILASQPLIKDAATAFGLPVTFAVAGPADVLCLLGALAIVTLAALVPSVRAGRIPAAQVIAGAMSPRTGASARVNRLFAPLPLGRAVTLGGALTFARPLRSLMTLIAVLLGVASVTFATGLQQSLTLVAAGILRTGAVQVVVQRQGSSDPQVSTLIGRQPGTARFVPERETDVSLNGVGQPVALYSYRGDSSWLGYQLIHGRWFHGAGEAVAPSALMAAAQLRVGKVTTLRMNGALTSVRIVGVILDQTNDNMLLRADWSTLTQLDPTAEADQYEVQVQPGTGAERYGQALMSAASPNVLFAQTNGDSGATSAFLLIDTVLAALALVLVAIAAAGVFNTVVLTTREQAREMAILKAVGMSPRQTLTVVLSSVVLVGAAGGGLGIPAGMALHRQILTTMAQIASRTELPASLSVVFSPTLLAAMLLAGLGLALAGAFLPGQWAARSRVTDVLHAE